MEAFGDGGDGVAVAHPHLRAQFEASEEGAVEVDGLKMGTTILTAVGLLDAPTEGVADILCAVADAQHGHAAYEL